MKKYTLHIILFFAIIVAFDFCFGKAFDYMVSHAKGGDTKATYDLLMKDQYDIIIMGSSRATHHYIPSMIEEATGMTCYNAGADGNGIILMYGRYKLITNRYNPKVILYDVEPPFDIEVFSDDDNNRRYISNLKDYFFHPEIKDIFTEVSRADYIKNHSGLFRYNGSYYSHLRDFISSNQIKDKGYLSFHGAMKKAPEQKIIAPQELDSLKLSYVRRLATEAKSRNIEFIFIASPKYGASLEDVQPVKDIAEELGIPFLNYYDVYDFQKIEYFYDTRHLNDDGAKIFTSEIINYLFCNDGIKKTL